jgi:hypothetical protein
MPQSVALRRPSAFLPIVMSVAALATIGVHIALAGTAPQPDEGTAAHLWQLLMAGQMPIVMFNAIKWLPRSPRPTLQILGAQCAAAIAALAPVYFLGW